MRFNWIWLLLVALVGVFSILFLWYTFLPGRVAATALQYFTAEQINLGREYSFVQRLLFISRFLVQGAFLLWLVFGGQAMRISQWIQQFTGRHYRSSILLFFLVLWLLLQLIDLPFQLCGRHFEDLWGFSNQSLGSWWLDYLKGAGLELILSIIGVMLFFWILNRWPRTWWLLGAVFVSLWLVIQSFLWPVVVSPLFNHFVPAKDPALTAMVEQLSRRAGLSVDQVLIMDASQRTTRANAYFAGLGHTKRIVLYDTLLANYPKDEVAAVVAHEMAHWRQGHIIKGLALGTVGDFIMWGLLFILLRLTVLYAHHDQAPPYTWAVVLLFFLLINFAGSPLQNYFSRGMEAEADRVSVQFTQNIPAAVRLQADLAVKNVSDVSPPAFIQWFSYSHPAALDRIKMLEQAATN